MPEGAPEGIEPEEIEGTDYSRRRELADFLERVRDSRETFAVRRSNGEFEVKGINNAWVITDIWPESLTLTDSSRHLHKEVGIDSFIAMQTEAADYYANPDNLRTPDDRLAADYLRSAPDWPSTDTSVESPADPIGPEVAATELTDEPDNLNDAEEQSDPEPILDDPIIPPDAQPPEPPQEPINTNDAFEPTGEQRDVILRHADNYLHSVDRERLESVPANKGILGKIVHRLKGSRSAAKKLSQTFHDAHDDDKWNKIIHPEKKLKGKNEQRNYVPSNKERRQIEEVARYREAIKYRDAAIKLIQEKRDAADLSPQRATEIDRELDHYYAYLMKLAHEDSYQLIFEREGKTFRDLNPKHKPRQPNESPSDYRNRIAPEKTDRRLKDVRLYMPGQPGFEPLATEAVEPKHKPAPVPAEGQQTKKWADERLEGERSGKYFTRIEKMVKENFGALGNREAVDSMTEAFRLLKDFSRSGVDLKKYGIEIDEKPSVKKYQLPGERRKGSNRDVIIPPTRSITMKVDQEYYTFTLYSDGFIEGDKRIAQPTNENPIQNISLRETRVSYDPEHHRPAFEKINPSLADISKNDRILDRLYRALEGMKQEMDARNR